MKNVFKAIEKEIKILDENLDFLASSKKDIKYLIEELYGSILNLREDFEHYIFKLALYKDTHIDKDSVYRKKIDENYIKERLFIENAIQKAKKDFEPKDFKELCKASERLCTFDDLDICAFKIFDELSQEFEALIKQCEDVLKNK